MRLVVVVVAVAVAVAVAVGVVVVVHRWLELCPPPRMPLCQPPPDFEGALWGAHQRALWLGVGPTPATTCQHCPGMWCRVRWST
jgi:hypothetical protein